MTEKSRPKKTIAALTRELEAARAKIMVLEAELLYARLELADYRRDELSRKARK